MHSYVLIMCVYCLVGRIKSLYAVCMVNPKFSEFMNIKMYLYSNETLFHFQPGYISGIPLVSVSIKNDT